ncbi:MAG TPA: hypothetical protein VF665_19120 [Longimicrobium sp.]|jgi:hypothetical protein|uniref:hypothetical protein n=1 Tax=Longimicrobium sp. TaxID=2029185 RepID=UPI002ED79FBB
MYVVQIFVPLRDNDGVAFPRAVLDALRQELTERFGGVTAHLRAPAAGAWKDEEGDVARDDVVIVEVMVDDLDRGWWSGYRTRLEERLRQDEMMIRALPCDRL